MGNNKKKKKKARKLYNSVTISLACIILIAALGLLFYIQEVKITGNEYCTKGEIIDAVDSDIFSGNSLYVLAKYKLHRGKVPPCIAQLEVSIEKPWVLNVKVKEKTIIGCVKKGKKYANFDSDGMVVLVTDKPREGVPLVKGIGPKNTELYQVIECKKPSVFEDVLNASMELAKYDLAADKIEYKNKGVYIYIGDVCVSLGEEVTTEKIAQIQPILEKLGNTKGVLHLEKFQESETLITFESNEKIYEKPEEEEEEAAEETLEN